MKLERLKPILAKIALVGLLVGFVPNLPYVLYENSQTGKKMEKIQNRIENNYDKIGNKEVTVLVFNHLGLELERSMNSFNLFVPLYYLKSISK